MTLEQEKLQIALKALNDIANWNDEMEDEYGDPGERAIEALVEIKKITAREDKR